MGFGRWDLGDVTGDDQMAALSELGTKAEFRGFPGAWPTCVFSCGPYNHGYMVEHAYDANRTTTRVTLDP